MKTKQPEKAAVPSSLNQAVLVAQARDGDANAQYLLAEAYRTGNSMPQDYPQALHWYLAAAKQGHPGAQNNAGSMYLNGLGTASNVNEAVNWYRRAAQQDQADAQFNLALRYLHGEGIELDPAAAAWWLFKAAEHGYVEAIGQLGTLYRFGQGVDQNFVAAADFHVIAALAGDVTSIGNLQDYQGEIERAAIAGSVLACLCLAKMYERGIAVAKDKAQVYAWLHWAQQYGTVDNDSDVLDELQQWADFETITLAETDKHRGQALLAAMESLRKGRTA